MTAISSILLSPYATELRSMLTDEKITEYVAPSQSNAAAESTQYNLVGKEAVIVFISVVLL